MLQAQFNAKVLTEMGQILAVWEVWGQGLAKVAIFTAKGTSMHVTVSFKPLCMEIG